MFRAIAGAEHVAGEQGSAFHILMLLTGADRLRIDIFDRTPPGRQPNKNYDTIARAKGFDQHIHRATTLRHIDDTGARIFPNFAEILTTLGVEPDPPSAPPQRLTHSARRLNRIAEITGASSYLEVGVAAGETLLGVELTDKTAVEPAFRFDHRSVDDGTRFFEVTSDQFFAHFTNARTRFDLVFLDGLHTFEQTFRDFCATLACTGPDTVWVIDDVMPSDPYSMLPTPAEAVRRRTEAGGKGGAWHGDVFKVVLAIREFFPNMDLRTIATGGNA